MDGFGHFQLLGSSPDKTEQAVSLIKRLHSLPNAAALRAALLKRLLCDAFCRDSLALLLGPIV